MQDTIFYIGGSKGGVGKSIIATALVQFLIDKYGDSKTVHLIETDESNPDVGRIYGGKIPVTPLILDERETGWISLFDLLEESEDTLFVINSAARSNYGVEANGENFSLALEDKSIAYDLVTFWPINRQIDCVNLLTDYLKVIQYGHVFVVRNTYWGAPKDFLIFNSMMSKAKNKSGLLERIEKVLDFPSLNDLITLQFYSYGKTIPEVSEKLNVFKRQLFSAWRANAYAMFEKTGLFGDASSEPVAETSEEVTNNV